LSVPSAAYNLSLDEEELLDLIRYDCLKAASGPSLGGFPDVRFGQWQRAVLNGEVALIRSNPLGREFSGYSLRESPSGRKTLKHT
jgi:hypothetical protein